MSDTAASATLRAIVLYELRVMALPGCAYTSIRQALLVGHCQIAVNFETGLFGEISDLGIAVYLRTCR